MSALVQFFVHLSTVIVSILLIILVLLQVKGGALGSLFGDVSSGLTRTRRGLEKTLFQLTVALSAGFLLICIIATVLLSPV
ncbi:MAG: preprotein translocase subunit SecG [Anaerolineae bacterium]|jgi:preprotein translocase subunit SecG|nr:preprotein translocase subunit SecG [Anaerolineae bacterium]